MNTKEMTKKLDDLIESKKIPEAKAFLNESMEQAKKEEDWNSLLILYNEKMGLCRELSEVEESYRCAEAACSLAEKMGLSGEIPYATTLLNAANAYRAGGRLQDSLHFYEKVQEIYEKNLSQQDMLMASLHNNISLLYQEMGEFEKAKENLIQALEITKQNENTVFEEAVTYTNLASTCLQLQQTEEALSDINEAIRLFESANLKDAHYAAALSALGTYRYGEGAFEEAADIFRKAMQVVKENLGENEFYERLRENYNLCRAKGFQPGLSLCEEYYETYGRDMIAEKFPDYAGKIAVGLVGEGSDCFGMDDAFSTDHDWGPGFCLWITRKTADSIGDALQKAYEELPAEFKGYKRISTPEGRHRVGVCTIEDFYGNLLRLPNREQVSAETIMAQIDFGEVPDEALAACVNGRVFTDPEGIFTAIRKKLKQGYPEKIRFLKMAEACAKFSQALQYNFERMEKRKDETAKLLTLTEGLRQAMKLCCYMEDCYPLHDKWLFQKIRSLPGYEAVCEEISAIAKTGICPEQKAHMENLAVLLSDRLYEADFVSERNLYLADSVKELLAKAGMCEKDVAALAEEIAECEFAAFDKVQNEGGRASCQDDWFTFSIMRKSQYLTWNKPMLMQYLWDFKNACAQGRNLITEKYGRMMESTAPDRYAEIADSFPEIPEMKKQIMEAIISIQVAFMEKFAEEYPHLATNARTIHTSEDTPYDTSYETYLRGELGTYSDKMLEMYGRFVAGVAGEGQNLAAMTMENSVKLYGYRDLKDAEEALGKQEKE